MSLIEEGENIAFKPFITFQLTPLWQKQYPVTGFNRGRRVKEFYKL